MTFIRYYYIYTIFNCSIIQFLCVASDWVYTTCPLLYFSKLAQAIQDVIVLRRYGRLPQRKQWVRGLTVEMILNFASVGQVISKCSDLQQRIVTLSCWEQYTCHRELNCSSFPRFLRGPSGNSSARAWHFHFNSNHFKLVMLHLLND